MAELASSVEDAEREVIAFRAVSNSHVDSAAMSGEALFRARIDALVPEDTDMDGLHDSLDEIANHMTLDIELD